MGSCGHCSTNVRDTCRLTHFLFRHPNPADFAHFQWFAAKWAFVVYRAVVFCYFAIWLCLFGRYFQVIFPAKAEVFFIYLTDWSLVVLVVHLLWALVVAAVVAVKDVKDETSAPPAARAIVTISWILQTIAQDAALMVTVGYWGWVRGVSSATATDVYDVHAHAINSVYVLVDVFVSAAPWRLQHFWVAQCYGIVYAVFTAVYWAAGGTDGSGKDCIYAVIDYSSQPGYAAVAVVLGILVAIPLAHLFMYVMYRLRRKLYECVRSRTGRYQLRQTPDLSGSANPGFSAAQ